MATNDPAQQFPDDNSTVSSGISAQQATDDIQSGTSSPFSQSPSVESVDTGPISYLSQQFRILCDEVKDQHDKVIASNNQVFQALQSNAATQMEAFQNQLESNNSHIVRLVQEISSLKEEWRDQQLKQDEERDRMQSLVLSMQKEIGLQRNLWQDYINSQTASAPLQTETLKLQENVVSLNKRLKYQQEQHEANFKNLDEQRGQLEQVLGLLRQE